MANSISTSIAPWLSVRNSAMALDFYTFAFEAVEIYKLETPEGIIAKLSIDGAEFWMSEESSGQGNSSPQSLGGSTARIILTVADPDAVFKKVLKAGGTQISPIIEEHGWKLGRLVDPFGHHWEIGHPLGK